MIIYIDSSAIIALAFEEPGFKTIQQKLRSTQQLFSHHLLEAELLAAARRENLSSALFSSLLTGVRLIFPELSLRQELEKVFEAGYIRGADALHLATALWLCGGRNSEIEFMTFDRSQSALAKKLGFRVSNVA